jgi:hypothetical protein
MKPIDAPFNIDPLLIDDREALFLKQVRSLDTFVGSTKNFHPEGLFSNEIFGIAGTSARYSKKAFIDLKVTIFHPVIYRALAQVKSLYIDIIHGKEFARWDPELQDLVKSDVVDGRTGFDFFTEYFHRIHWPNNQSESRQMAIELLEAKKNKALIRRIAVLPAGFREFEIDERGQESSSEFNDYYYRLISVSNNINIKTIEIAPESHNSQRSSMQRTLDELYALLYQVVDGKNNLLMGKVASRRVMAGTRNVITAMNSAILDLFDDSAPTANHTAIGLYQMAKSIIFVTIDRIKNGWISECFSSPNSPVRVTDPKTMKSDYVMMEPKTYSDWLGSEGLEQQITFFKESTARHLPIKLEGYYLGLVYEDFDKGIFCFVHGVEELPMDADPSKCRPITMTDLLHRSIYPVANKYVGFVTRYPITGLGSIYPSNAFLKTTNEFKKLQEYDHHTWQPIQGQGPANQYPIHGAAFFDSMSPHPWKIGRLGADFDGDMCSWTVVMADESLSEARRYFNSTASVIGTDGRMIDSFMTDTVTFVLDYSTNPIPSGITPELIDQLNATIRSQA